MKSIWNVAKKPAHKRADIFSAIETLISYTEPELDGLIEHPATPILTLTIAKALKRDLTAGKTDTVEIIFDRLFGKAKDPHTNAEDDANNTLNKIVVEIVEASKR